MLHKSRDKPKMHLHSKTSALSSDYKDFEPLYILNESMLRLVKAYIMLELFQNLSHYNHRLGCNSLGFHVIVQQCPKCGPGAICGVSNDFVRLSAAVKDKLK